jgi:hypothetical protein
VPLTTGSLKLQSVRHSLAATVWQRSRCSVSKRKKTSEKKGEEQRVRIIYTGNAFDASVFHLSIIIIAETSTGKRPPIAIAARVCQMKKKIFPDNRIINSGIGVAVAFSRSVRNR